MSTTYKSCTKCNNEHSKPGVFCSRSCANSRGPRSDDFKNKVKEKLSGRQGWSAGKQLIRRVESSCIICGSIILVTPRYAARRLTCGSTTCKRAACAEAGKVSASKRVKRSKQEIELFELCKEVFHDSLANHIIADGWDADIVIPSLMLAIMWNGPWHYKEMNMTNHSLKQVQNRDNIKRKLFESLGWKVLEFKDCDYTPTSAFERIMVEGRGYAPLP